MSHEKASSEPARSSAMRAASSDWRVSALAKLPMVRSACKISVLPHYSNQDGFGIYRVSLIYLDTETTSKCSRPRNQRQDSRTYRGPKSQVQAKFSCP